MDKETLTAIHETAQDRDITLLAAGFAYYAFVSLIPLVILGLVIGSSVGVQIWLSGFVISLMSSKQARK